MTFSRVLILGCGYTGTAALRQAAARGLAVTATVRRQEAAAALRGEHVKVLCAPTLDASIAEHVDENTHVIVSFQPDPATDDVVAQHLAGAHSIAYISSTGVFGELRGKIDDHSAPPVPPSERSARILRAEAQYREQGATVLRASGIYGPDRGLHLRVIRGEHKIPGDGSRMLSRIHVHDLAAFALAAGDHEQGQTFVIGDAEPAPHIEVVQFICQEYGCALPPSIPLEQAHATLQADRSVDSSGARQRLGVTLKYPSYREGMSRAATGLRRQSDR
jgi:nucleoside-diphosphate-sugar epimerase